MGINVIRLVSLLDGQKLARCLFGWNKGKGVRLRPGNQDERAYREHAKMVVCFHQVEV